MTATIEDRLRAVEDRIAIAQVVCGCGYAIDGLNRDAVGDTFTETGIYAVGDVGAMNGRAAIQALTADPQHLGYVAAGCAHMSTAPYIVLDGDRAVATCHTMVGMHGDDGFFIGRMSASRITLARQDDNAWRIEHRQNTMLNGDPAVSHLLGRLNEGPSA